MRRKQEDASRMIEQAERPTFDRVFGCCVCSETRSADVSVNRSNCENDTGLAPSEVWKDGFRDLHGAKKGGVELVLEITDAGHRNQSQIKQTEGCTEVSQVWDDSLKPRSRRVSFTCLPQLFHSTGLRVARIVDKEVNRAMFRLGLRNSSR